MDYKQAGVDIAAGTTSSAHPSIAKKTFRPRSIRHRLFRRCSTCRATDRSRPVASPPASAEAALAFMTASTTPSARLVVLLNAPCAGRSRCFFSTILTGRLEPRRCRLSRPAAFFRSTAARSGANRGMPASPDGDTMSPLHRRRGGASATDRRRRFAPVTSDLLPLRSTPTYSLARRSRSTTPPVGDRVPTRRDDREALLSPTAYLP